MNRVVLLNLIAFAFCLTIAAVSAIRDDFGLMAFANAMLAVANGLLAVVNWKEQA